MRCALVAVTALVCGALLAAAALVPAPAAVVPFVVVVGIALPMAAACELPRAVARLRRGAPGHRPLDPSALERLRRQLDALPETRHPLGL